MRLRVLLPWRVEVEEPVSRVRAEALNGSFTLLPRHVDIATALRPGLLSYVSADGQEIFLAVDGGTLVKVGDEVLVATPSAIRGPGLAELRHQIDDRSNHVEEREQRARTALERIGSDVVQRIVELGELTHRD
ncbi:MAG: F0F1 ATP synthase subunit epsilon [Chloroflexi bacterium]|nr:F0F1 ATP synthase subunit epsilon [Chloroflexota bacterium]